MKSTVVKCTADLTCQALVFWLNGAHMIEVMSAVCKEVHFLTEVWLPTNLI